MTAAQRQQRRRDKAKALRDSVARPANQVSQNVPVQRGCAQSPAALELLAGNPEAIAARICANVSVDTARGIAVALQQRIWQGGGWPPWLPPIL